MNKSSRLRTGRASGFTIIELLVVVAIIALLTSIAMVIYTDAREKGRDGRRFEDIQQIKNAIELYSVDHAGLFPPGNTLDVLETEGHIQKMPTDPKSGSAYIYQAINPFTGLACGSSPCASYVLKTVLEQSSQDALGIDVDGVLGGIDCSDPSFCIIP